MLNSYYRISTLLLLTVLAGCGGSQTTENSDNGTPADQNSTANAETGNPEQAGGKTESAVLKQEMIDITAEHMKAQKPDADPQDASSQVEQGIARIRKDDPEFLMVSAETEKKLQAGEPVADAAQRIEDAEKMVTETQTDISGLTKVLLTEYKAGKLSPARTELLAQLLAAHTKKIGANPAK